MLRSRITFVIIFLIVCSYQTFSQTLPKWIYGGWHNSAESNLERHLAWSFTPDTIYLGKIFPSEGKDNQSLETKYVGYKKTITSSGNTCRVDYFKPGKRLIYEFRLLHAAYTDRPIMSYSLTVNGKKLRHHSNSINEVFAKMED